VLASPIGKISICEKEYGHKDEVMKKLQKKFSGYSSLYVEKVKRTALSAAWIFVYIMAQRLTKRD